MATDATGADEVVTRLASKSRPYMLSNSSLSGTPRARARSTSEATFIVLVVSPQMDSPSRGSTSRRPSGTLRPARHGAAPTLSPTELASGARYKC